MYFKSIELNGFKSFVDHTKISFGEGFTAIVGPNGCGKSNISDAIRWVLGEQRPKLLRGAKMEDFIFSGSAARKPSGMAEVSITLTEIAGMISKPELAEYNEVTVTRRLYRSGESEYLINKTPCRLKDIVDIFLDTGISTRAFSIIEQDQIQRIVTSKPEDRRFIIEEAAGIMKYKNRRHAALGKLDNSQQNLERISDIISELERQKNSLKRQAGKAERYGKLKSEMLELLKATSADEYRTQKSLETSLSVEMGRLEEVRVSLETDISSRKNDFITLQASVDELADSISSLKEEEYRLAAAIEKDEGNITLFTRQIKDAESLIARYGTEANELAARIEDMRLALAEKEERIAQISIQVEEKNGILGSRREECSAQRTALDDITSKTRNSEREVGDLAGRISSFSNRIASNTTRAEMLETRMRRLEEEKAEAVKTLENVTSKKDALEAESRTHDETYDSLKSERASLAERLAMLKEAKQAKDEAIYETKTLLTESRTRHGSLTEIEQAYEGYADGVRSLLSLKDANPEIASILKGKLVDKITVNPRIEAAFEMILGDKVQALLTDSPNDAKKAIEFLRTEKLGRATFLPMDSVEGLPLPNLAARDGVIGHAMELVETDNGLRPLMQRLLSDVVFVENLDAAIRLRPTNHFTYVTPDGDVIDRFGTISGGSPEGAGGGILERKRAIQELEHSIRETEATLDNLNIEASRINSELADVDIEISSKDKSLKEEEIFLLHARKDMESLASEENRHRTRLETYKAETDQLEMEKDNLLGEISRLENDLKEITSQKEALQSNISILSQQESEARQALATLTDSLSQIEIELTSLNGELKMANSEKNAISNGIAEISSRIASMENDIEANTVKKRELDEMISRLREEIHEYLSRKEKVSIEYRELSERMEALNVEREEKEAELKEREASLEQTRENLNEVRIKFSETTMRLSTLLERMEENNIQREDIEHYDVSELDITECKERLAKAREAIAGIGDVNLSAIEDYNQVAERLNFLTTQRDDLVESINDIKKVIERLNRTTKKLFEEAYHQIRENFQSTFKRLFNGGEADILLTDEENLLESGIEIMVRPPGKRRQNITLLSAGEKAMTALSILFSVFMVKPSPFCLLDEVDAPLDETNLGRFKAILKDFAGNTQFLVITHNQKTMAFADRLYGITMQEPGVTKVLSVDIVEMERSPEDSRLHAVTA